MDPTILAAQSGDRGALAELLMQYRRVVTAAVLRFAWDRSQLPDIVQSVFARAAQAISGFQNRCAFSTWIYRIAVNECVDCNRRTARQREREQGVECCEVLPDLNAADGLAAVERAELMQGVRLEVAALPLGLRTAFSLFYFGGYSGKEAAQALGITESNFFMRLKGARDRVREGLRSRGLAP